MPDGVLFLKGMAAAAGASALFVLALGWIRGPAGATRLNLAAIVAVCLGLVLGWAVLEIRPRWPPTNALDRYLAIIVPAVVGIEMLGGLPGVPRWLLWTLRLSLSAAAGRILLHGSVYVAPQGGEWTALQAWISLGSSALLLAVVWYLLLRLADRTPGVSIPLAIAETSLFSGVAIMLAGYLTGGKTAMALAAALAGAAGALFVVAARPVAQGIISLGVVGLFGLLFVGRYFGGLATGRALALMLTPLLCWCTELPILRGRKPWLIGGIRLILVAVPLIVVVILEKREFDQHTAPLMGATKRTDTIFAHHIEDADSSEHRSR